MPRVVVSIPHQLDRDEVKRRIGLLIEKAQPLGGWSERWISDTHLFVKGRVHQQLVTGEVAISERSVKVTVNLPWTLTLFASRVKQSLEQSARRALAS